MTEDYWGSTTEWMWELYSRVWGAGFGEMSPRQVIATFFATRTMRRALALTRLFESGLYPEAIPLIRSAYEDWIQLAHTLAVSDDSRAIGLMEQVSYVDAQVLQGFRRLVGIKAARDAFSPIPEDVAQLADLQPKELRVPTEWKSKAAEVGLAQVHAFVYPYLSELAHGSIKGFDSLFEETGTTVSVQTPERDLTEEFQWALWSIWFQLRVLTLAAREFDVNVEHYSDQLLSGVKSNKRSMETCVMRKEHVTPS